MGFGEKLIFFFFSVAKAKYFQGAGDFFFEDLGKSIQCFREQGRTPPPPYCTILLKSDLRLLCPPPWLDRLHTVKSPLHVGSATPQAPTVPPRDKAKKNVEVALIYR